MRSARLAESASCEPPKPRLTTGKEGKWTVRLVHFLMLELPTKTMQFLGGGLVLSLASNALISFSHLVESWVAREFGDGVVWQLAVRKESRASEQTNPVN